MLIRRCWCWPGPGCAGTRNGGWAAVVGVGLFLGVAATFYTLLLAYTAFTVVVMALLAAIARRSVEPRCGWR